MIPEPFGYFGIELAPQARKNSQPFSSRARGKNTLPSRHLARLEHACHSAQPFLSLHSSKRSHRINGKCPSRVT